MYPRCVHGIKSSGVPFGRVCWASIESVAAWIVSLVVLLVVSTHLERYTHRIHGTGIFTYIYYIKNQPNVGKDTSPMDPIGYFVWNRRGNHFSISSGVIMLQTQNVCTTRSSSNHTNREDRCEFGLPHTSCRTTICSRFALINTLNHEGMYA